LWIPTLKHTWTADWNWNDRLANDWKHSGLLDRFDNRLDPSLLTLPKLKDSSSSDSGSRLNLDRCISPGFVEFLNFDVELEFPSQLWPPKRDKQIFKSNLMSSLACWFWLFKLIFFWRDNFDFWAYVGGMWRVFGIGFFFIYKNVGSAQNNQALASTDHQMVYSVDFDLLKYF